jgi:hypothetical protein
VAFEDENYFPGAFQVLGEKIAVAKGNRQVFNALMIRNALAGC